MTVEVTVTPISISVSCADETLPPW